MKIFYHRSTRSAGGGGEEGVKSQSGEGVPSWFTHEGGSNNTPPPPHQVQALLLLCCLYAKLLHTEERKKTTNSFAMDAFLNKKTFPTSVIE